MAESRKLHVVMFPWLAFGHMIPFLELAKHIAQKGHQISFISTPQNVKRLPKIPPHLSSFIDFVTFNFPHENNLPQNAEATSDVPYHLMHYLKKAYDGFREPAIHFLETTSPDWVIYDFVPYWLPPVAEKLRISRAFFCIVNASAMTFFGSPIPEITGIYDRRTKMEDYTVTPEWVPFPANLAFREFEAKRIFDFFFENPSNDIPDMIRVQSAILGCEAFAIRTCMEVESDWLKLLGELHQKPIFPMGLMPPSINIKELEDKEDSTWETIAEWLDKKEKGSVVYLALGSEVTPSQEDFTELAHGLELSGLSFFWALRKRRNWEETDSVELPDGFEERVNDRGVVWTGWAPQLKILSHDSVGGFMTHCGWSSIVEGISFGRPLIMFPVMGDQGMNARAFEEKMIGAEIPRDEQTGAFSRIAVAETLKLIMVKEEGNIYREKVKEMSEIFGDTETQQGYIDTFIDHLQNYRDNKRPLSE